MKKILILHSSANPKISKIGELLKERVKDVDIHVNLEYKNIKIILLQNKFSITCSGIDLKDFDLVIFYTTKSKMQHIASSIAYYCKYNKVNFINERELFTFNAGKVFQKSILSLNQISTPDFIFKSEYTEADYELLKEQLGEILICKENKSTKGRGVYLIKEFNEFKKMISIEGNIFFEKFIEHTVTTRGFVTDDRCSVAITSSQEANSFKTNYGNFDFSNPVDQNFIDTCIAAAQLMRLQIAGVDTIRDSHGKLFVLEVNKSPEITIDRSTAPEIDALSDLIKQRLNI